MSRFKATFVSRYAPLTAPDSAEWSSVPGEPSEACFAAERYSELNYEGGDPDAVDDFTDVLEVATGRVSRWRVSAEAEVRFDAWKCEVVPLAAKESP